MPKSEKVLKEAINKFCPNEYNDLLLKIDVDKEIEEADLTKEERENLEKIVHDIIDKKNLTPEEKNGLIDIELRLNTERIVGIMSKVCPDEIRECMEKAKKAEEENRYPAEEEKEGAKLMLKVIESNNITEKEREEIKEELCTIYSNIHDDVELKSKMKAVLGDRVY